MPNKNILIWIFVLTLVSISVYSARDTGLVFFSDMEGTGDMIDNHTGLFNISELGTVVSGRGCSGQARENFTSANYFYEASWLDHFNSTNGWTWSFWVMQISDSNDFEYFFQASNSLESVSSRYQGGSSNTQHHSQSGSQGQITSGTPDLTVGTFHHLVLTYNGTGDDQYRFYQNGTYITNASTVTSPLWTSTDEVWIGRCSHANVFAADQFKIDTVAVYNNTRTDAEILDLYNGGTCINYSNMVVAVPETSSMDMLFSPEDDPTNYKTNFDEGEDFLAFINWTDDADNSVLNDSVGECNLTYENGTMSVSADNQNFTLCSSGCDFASYTDDIQMTTNESVIMDYIHLNACHEQVASGSFTVNASCEGGGFTDTVTAGEISLCSLNSTFIIFNFSNCFGKNEVNVTLTTAVPLSQRKQITSLDWDREFSEHTETYDGGGVIFNSTVQLWASIHGHEYYTSGTQFIRGNCTHSTNSEFDNSMIGNISIANDPSVVDFLQIFSPSNIVYNWSDELEYENGTWSFIIGVSDRDGITSVNYTFTNNTGDEFYNVFGDTPVPSINLSAFTYFIDFDEQPYNLSVQVVDDLGAQSSIFVQEFYFNDTGVPQCDFASDSGTQDLNYTFDVTCTDENFYSLNVSCDTPYSFYVDGLNVESYDFTGTFLLTATSNCTAWWYDGHTKKYINDMKIKDKPPKEKLIDDKIKIVVDNADVVSFDLIKLTDRYNFNISLGGVTDHYIFDIESDEKIVYMPNSNYRGHLVTGDYWIDFENPYFYDINVSHITYNHVIVDVELISNYKNVMFESIGILNGDNISFVITATPPPRTDPFINMICPLDDTTAGVLGYFIIIVLLAGLYFFNQRTINLPIMGIAVAVGLIFWSVPMYNCGIFVSIPFTLFGLFMLIYETVTGWRGFENRRW